MTPGRILKERWLFSSWAHLFISSLVTNMRTNLLKIVFPDILNLERALIEPKSLKVKLINHIIKIFTEDHELFIRLATNEPLN